VLYTRSQPLLVFIHIVFRHIIIFVLAFVWIVHGKRFFWAIIWLLIWLFFIWSLLIWLFIWLLFIWLFICIWFLIWLFIGRLFYPRTGDWFSIICRPSRPCERWFLCRRGGWIGANRRAFKIIIFFVAVSPKEFRASCIQLPAVP